LLGGPRGLASTAAELAQAEAETLPQIDPQLIFEHNVAAEVAERALELKYPMVSVFCEKVVNDLRQKFRTFSGKVALVAEVRASQDRLEGLERAAQLYADALAQVLERSRGDWGNGMYYAGGYTIDFTPVKRGGRGFLQAARVRFEVDVNQ
jgi:hypothetical protein